MLSPASAVFGSMAVATAAMLLMSGERWHSDAASRPTLLGSEGMARVLVVFQESDCPDDLRSVEDLLRALRRRDLEADLVGIGSESSGLLGFIHPGMAPSDRPIHRAILRSGIGSTPVALLLDPGGVVRFVHPLARPELDGHPEEVAEALEVLAAMMAPRGTGLPGTEGE
jgi:hypothetical protein